MGDLDGEVFWKDAIKNYYPFTRQFSDENDDSEVVSPWRSEIINYYPFRTTSSVVKAVKSKPNNTPNVILHFRLSCSGGKLPVRASPRTYGNIISYLRNGSLLAVYSNTIAGFYKLADGSGYINKNTLGVTWNKVSEHDVKKNASPTKKAVVEQHPKILQLMYTGGDGKSIKIPVRSTPDIHGDILSYLKNGSVCTVRPNVIKGFFELHDTKVK